MLVLFVYSLITPSLHAETGNPILKTLLIQRAQEYADAVFGGTFNPKDAQLLTAKEIPAALKRMEIDVGKLPERTQKAIKREDTVALLILSMKVPNSKRDTGTSKTATPEQQMMMAYWAEEDWQFEAVFRGEGAGGGSGTGGGTGSSGADTVRCTVWISLLGEECGRCIMNGYKWCQTRYECAWPPGGQPPSYQVGKLKPCDGAASSSGSGPAQ